MHFVSNVDGHDIDAALAKVGPGDHAVHRRLQDLHHRGDHDERADRARLVPGSSAAKTALAQHFVAVSTNAEAIKTFGIDPANMFGFWDWVGGRYSLWSAIGLPVALAVGFGYFQRLAGRRARDGPALPRRAAGENMPVLLALVGVWNRKFLGCASVARSRPTTRA